MQYAQKEIAAALDNFSEVYVSEKFIIIETDAGEKDVTALASNTIFVDNAIPLIGVFDYKSGFANIVVGLNKSLEKKEKFRLEAFNINSGTKQNAKAIEVKIGQELERMGHVADLNDPDINIYVIFSEGSAYVGRLARKDHKILDEFRRFNKESSKKISRAEFKLTEAFEYFKVDTKKIRSAIDVGAAPGGWSKIISDLGIKVLAIDKAELAYKSSLIIHVKERGDKVDDKVLEEFGKADLLLVDANIDPKSSSGLVLKFSGRIKEGAYLILTLKIVDGSVDKHIKTAKDALSRDFTSIKLKKLPHNRLEITCFAVKK